MTVPDAARFQGGDWDYPPFSSETPRSFVYHGWCGPCPEEEPEPPEELPGPDCAEDDQNKFECGWNNKKITCCGNQKCVKEQGKDPKCEPCDIPCRDVCCNEGEGCLESAGFHFCVPKKDGPHQLSWPRIRMV